MFFFRNAVYVYVCKINEKLGGCWWSFLWLGQKLEDRHEYAQRPPTELSISSMHSIKQVDTAASYLL